jgi:hypothetical protein
MAQVIIHKDYPFFGRISVKGINFANSPVQNLLIKNTISDIQQNENNTIEAKTYT